MHMKKLIFLFPLVILVSMYGNCQRVHQLFDASWKFHRGDIQNVEKEDLNDQNWRQLNLPHDWSIEDLPNQSDSVIGPFSSKSIGATATGYTIGGIGWYRKHFIENNAANKKVTICFDGIYMNSDVYINGHHLGNHPYGYTPFSYDITPYLKKNGEENVVAVRVSNEGKNSRWYSGSGIYRHVWLTVTPELHLAQWGVYITTPEVSSKTATINIKSSLVNEDVAGNSVILY